MRTYCSDKDVNKFIKSQIKKGWVFSRGKKHSKLTSAYTKRTVVISTSPSDKRYLVVLKQLMKRIEEVT